VITGISGSGKSSLAFDTLYAEGRNRFLESFSSYARAQMGIKEKPGFEKVTRLTPTFAVDQRDPGNNPRSTVGTYTGIYDILRLLFARFAVWHPEPLNPLKGTYSLPFRGGPGRGASINQKSPKPLSPQLVWPFFRGREQHSSFRGRRGSRNKPGSYTPLQPPG